MAWLSEDLVCQVTFDGHAWKLRFKSGASVHIECLWRLFKDGRISCTSGDHGHPFGLGKPFDGVAALSELANDPVTSSWNRNGTADLVLTFASGAVLEILQDSGGYESWSAVHPQLGQVFAASGGQLHALGVGA